MDTEALAKSLEADEIAGAGLDVVENEPSKFDLHQSQRWVDDLPTQVLHQKLPSNSQTFDSPR